MECGEGQDGCQLVPQTVALAGFGDRFLRNKTGHRFEKRVPVTRLPFYNLNQNATSFMRFEAFVKVEDNFVDEMTDIMFPGTTHKQSPVVCESF